MLEPIPSARLSPCGFQAAAKVSPLNQNQPMIEISPTGRMTPHTVTEPIRPVMEGPPKLATVVSQSSAITPERVAIGVDDSQGKNAARYPTAEIAMATLRDRQGEEVQKEHLEVARLAVGVLGVGRHAARALIEDAGLREPVGDGHRAERRHDPGQQRDRADLRHVRRQHDDPRAHHVHRDDERQLHQVHLLLLLA